MKQNFHKESFIGFSRWNFLAQLGDFKINSKITDNLIGIIPSVEESKKFFNIAKANSRLRSHKILHKTGAYKNAVLNFMLKDTYMKPHLHPGEEKIEHIYLLKGELDMFYFDDNGDVTSKKSLSASKNDLEIVPAYKWHTYLMISDTVITYETMNGIYDPNTWKLEANWAPNEQDEKSRIYMRNLRLNFVKN